MQLVVTPRNTAAPQDNHLYTAVVISVIHLDEWLF
jgi:hypothetical protein